MYWEKKKCLRSINCLIVLLVSAKLPYSVIFSNKNTFHEESWWKSLVVTQNQIALKRFKKKRKKKEN